MNNYEKYFGSPEKLAQSEVLMTIDKHRPLYVRNPQFSCTKGFDDRDEFLEWLQEECDE